MNKRVNGAAAAQDAQGAAEAAIGKRLRLLRKIRQRPLQTIAAETGLSIGLISQIERGLSSPSVKHLMALGQVLGVSISWFFDEAATLDPSEAPLVVRRETRRQLSMDHGSVRKELLSPDGGHAQQRVFLLTVEPGGNSGKGFYAHDGEVCGILLSGALHLWVDKQKLVLREGDSFAIPRDAMRRFVNPDARAPSILVWSIAYFSRLAEVKRAIAPAQLTTADADI